MRTNTRSTLEGKPECSVWASGNNGDLMGEGTDDVWFAPVYVLGGYGNFMVTYVHIKTKRT